ncbi:MAG: hypothetical protein L3K17_06315 [Thermoplasmata archaeon]|nr:hypothetical protein [Thermoplasmata archaeon]
MPPTIAAPPARATLPGGGRTVLIFGDRPRWLALWAAGIAFQEDPSFAWSEIAPGEADPNIAPLMSVSSNGPRIMGVGPEEVAPPPHLESDFGQLLLGPSGEETLRSRLEDYLGLPALVQLLAARATRPNGRSSIVILGLDRLPAATLASSFEREDLHRILRREGVMCALTFSGTPAPRLVGRFDTAIEFAAGSGRELSDAQVRVTHGAGSAPRAETRTLHDQWDELGLAGPLLALWSRPEFVPRRPV